MSFAGLTFPETVKFSPQSVMESAEAAAEDWEVKNPDDQKRKKYLIKKSGMDVGDNRPVVIVSTTDTALKLTGGSDVWDQEELRKAQESSSTRLPNTASSFIDSEPVVSKSSIAPSKLDESLAEILDKVDDLFNEAQDIVQDVEKQKVEHERKLERIRTAKIERIQKEAARLQEHRDNLLMTEEQRNKRARNKALGMRRYDFGKKVLPSVKDASEAARMALTERAPKQPAYKRLGPKEEEKRKQKLQDWVIKKTTPLKRDPNRPAYAGYYPAVKFEVTKSLLHAVEHLGDREFYHEMQPRDVKDFSPDIFYPEGKERKRIPIAGKV